MPNIVSNKLGRTGLTVTNVALGTSPLGSSPNLYGYAVDEERALDTMRAFFSGPLNFADTSNNYGQGRSEWAIGKVIRELGGIPAGKVLATKVDADPDTHDFSGDRVRRSAEESLERLGLERFQLLHLHDPDLHMDFATGSRKGGAVDALVALKEQGIAESIGIATGNLQALTDYLNTDVFDVLLSHNRYTLLDRSAEPLMNACVYKHVAFLNAAPYGGGPLARGPGLRLEIALVDSFYALVPTGPSPTIVTLAANIVAEFDSFRRPMTPEEFERRAAARYKSTQLANLAKWGSPFVFDQFTFHMTLTGPVPRNERDHVALVLERYFGSEPVEIEVDRLVLAVQDEMHESYRIHSTHAFASELRIAS